MKAKQLGGPARLVHRCFVVYRPDKYRLGRVAALLSVLLGVGGFSFAKEPTSLDDYAQVYVGQYFEPSAELKLNESSKRKSRALSHYALGRTLEVQGKVEEAIEAYTEVLRNQPNQFFLARKTAYLLAQSGRQKEALALLEDSLRNNEDKPFVHIALSEYLAIYQNNDPEALQRSFEIIENAVKQFPDEIAVYEHLVKLFLSADRRDDARQIIAEASKRENSDPQFWLRLGQLATVIRPVGEEVSEADLVNAIYGKALQYAEDDLAVIERVGDFYHATGQLDHAVKAYEEAIKLGPEMIPLREKLARVYGAKGDEEKVVETLKEIVEIDAQNADVHKQIAGIYLRSGRFKEAIPHLQTALSITKGSSEEYAALARMMIEMKEYDVAIGFIKDSAYLFPESPDFPFLLTFPLASLERWGDAVKQFETALHLAKEKQPQLLNEYFYFRYAAAHERNSDFGKAEELFRKTIEMIAKNNPDDSNQEFTATVYNYLGYMWLENDKNIDEAGELIKTAVELSPDSGAIADSLGWFYFKKGKYEEAKEELLRAESQIEEPDSVIFDHIGQVYYQLGEKLLAIEYMEKAVELDSEKEEYRTRLQAYKKEILTPMKTEEKPTPTLESSLEKTSADKES